MDQIDAFPENISTTVVPVTLPEKPDALEYAARQGQVRACIIYQKPNTKRVFVLFCKDNWYQKKTLVDNFKRAIMEEKHVNEFRPDDVLWEKISKRLLRNPDRPLKNTDKRMVYIYNNMFFVKKDFTFGFRTVKSGEIHLIQTTNVPMVLYEFPSSSLRCRANPNLFRRSFEPYDQILYHRMVLEPHTAYPIPAGTRYILLTVQKTVFGLDIIPETILPQLMENGFNLGDFRKMKRDKQTTFGTTARAFLQTEQSVYHTRHQTTCLIARPSTALATPQPVSIPEPPVLTIPHILLPDPPPELTTPLVQIPDPPVQIPVFQPPVQISPVPTTPPAQIPDPPPERTTPLVQIPDPPVQIPPVSTTPSVQLSLPDPPPVKILLPDPPPVVETF
ncbi:uncharacterized protein TNCV_547031 [Trichonephila clavipes]|nr:uncharacterized protein TNCV_547031 [Trichonephila clavipes]